MVFYTLLSILKKYRKSQLLLILGVFTSIQILQADTTSMKGQKAEFSNISSYGTLHDGVEIPTLNELTVCINIWRSSRIKKWIAFTYYISQSGDKQELGIGGEDNKLIVWFSGIKHQTIIKVLPNIWHVVCLMWSNSSSKGEVYLNGSLRHIFTSVSKINDGGNLVLGHYQQQKQGSDIEFNKSWAFSGELYYFRLWNFTLKSPGQDMKKCTDGNVINWQPDHLIFTDKTLVNDSTLPCGTSNGITSTVSPSFSTSQMTSPPKPTTSRTTETMTSSSSLLTSTTTAKSILPTMVTVPSLTNSLGSSPVSASSVPVTTQNPISPGVHLFNTTMIIQLKNFDGESPSFQEIQNISINWKHISGNNTTVSVALGADSLQLNNINTNIVFLHLNLLDLQRQNMTTGIIINADKIQRNSFFDSEYICRTVLEVTSAEEELQLKQEIKDTLTSENYTDSTLMLSVDPFSICINLLVPGFCSEEFISTDKGNYTWPLTEPLKTVKLNCVIPTTSMAKRECNLNFVTIKAEWADHNLDNCMTLLDSILDLENIIINSTNADEYAHQILALTNNTSDWSKKEISIIVSKISLIGKLGNLSPTLVDNVIGIVDNLLNKANDIYHVSSDILSIINNLGDKFDFLDFQKDFVKRAFTVTMVNANSSHFNGMSFAIDSHIEHPMVYNNSIISNKSDLFIVLPNSLQNYFETEHGSPTSRIQFHLYKKTSLFQDKSLNNQSLHSYVVSASVPETEIINLSDPVQIKLHHLYPKLITEQVTCVFWDNKQNNSAWNSSGCTIIHTDVNYTICGCNHLTHFGILLGMSGSRLDLFHTKLLSFITYVGCGASSIFLGIVLLTYLIFEELRRDYPSKILLNLCTALFMLNMVFLVDTWISSYESSILCISAAVFLHYFLLASFTWMGIEAINMYFALVKVFNIYVRHYILKFCIIGWGLPAIVVIVVLSIDKTFYGIQNNSAKPTDATNMLCWFKNITAFYISVVAYFSIAFLVNLVMFIVVLKQIHTVEAKMCNTSRQNAFLHNVKRTASLTVLLGLTWGFAFFAWGPVQITFMYLFTIFNTLQGVFIFVFHCLMKENVRKQWKMHLYCGRSKLIENYEWNRTHGKLIHFRKSSSAYSNQSSKSNLTASSSNG